MNESGQELFLTVKQASSRAKKSLKRANKRKKRLKTKLKNLKGQLKRIKQKLIPRPGTAKKIKSLKSKISNAKKAVSTVEGQRKNLVLLRKQVIACGKEEPLTGGIVIKTVFWPSTFFNGQYTSYNIGIFYNMVRPVSFGQSYCVRTNQGVTSMSTVINPCPIRDGDYNCIAQHFGVSGLGISGITGTDYVGGGAPQLCAAGDPTYKCDLSAAQVEASNIAAAIGDVVVLGKYDSINRCKRFE